MANIHVVPRGTKWEVEGKGMPHIVAEDKKTAMRKGREEAGKRGIHLTVHGKDGTIQKVIKPMFKNNSPNQHVVPHDGKWAVRPEHGKKVSSTYFWRLSAVRRAREIAKNYHSDLVIHDSNGKISSVSKPGLDGI